MTVPGHSRPTTPATPAHSHATPAKPTTAVGPNDPASTNNNTPSEHQGNHSFTKHDTTQHGKPSPHHASPDHASPDHASQHNASPVHNKPTKANPGDVIVFILHPTAKHTAENNPSQNGHNRVGGTTDPHNIDSDENSGGVSHLNKAANSDSSIQDNVIGIVDSQPIQLAPGKSAGVVIGGSKTLRPGQVTTTNNTPVSVGNDKIVVGEKTLTIPASKIAEVQLGAVVNAGGSQVTAVAVGTPGAVVIAGETLSEGQITAIAGQTVKNVGTGIIVDSSTAAFSRITSGQAAPTTRLVEGAILTLGSMTRTAIEADGIVTIGGHVLLPGEVGTINGQTVSDASTAVIIY